MSRMPNVFTRRALRVACVSAALVVLSACGRQPNAHEQTIEEPDYVEPAPEPVDDAGRPGEQRFLPTIEPGTSEQRESVVEERIVQPSE